MHHILCYVLHKNTKCLKEEKIKTNLHQNKEKILKCPFQSMFADNVEKSFVNPEA